MNEVCQPGHKEVIKIETEPQYPLQPVIAEQKNTQGGQQDA